MSRDFIAPECVVEIAGKDYEPIGVTTNTSRTTPIARADVFLNPDEFSWADLRGAELAVYFGLGADMLKVFSGRIHAPVPANPLRVVALDAIQDLKDTIVTASIVRPTLKDVTDVLFLQAGKTDTLVMANDVQTRLFVAKSIHGLDVIQAARQSFGVGDWDFYADPSGRIYFGPWVDSPRAKSPVQLELTQGINIDELVPDFRGGKVITSLAPWVFHGHLITISDPEVSRATITARVERVIHRIDATNGGMTELQWTPV